MGFVAFVPVVALALSQTPSDVSAYFGGRVPEFYAEWYAKALRRMGEASLARAPTTAKVYRLTILPTWGHPVSVRLHAETGSEAIEAKRLDGLGGYEPGRLAEQGSLQLSADQMNQFRSLYGKLGFWQMAFGDPGRGYDGSEWILEAAELGKYHVVARWSPSSETDRRGLRAFVGLCEWLFRASPLANDLRNKGTAEILKRPR
ncbi:MAG: hypothetical protein HZB56_11890 [Deltaproteobacteria bacterium]|nr:hypothetical protein [Deltaproteobacteria bacterium]